jgi:hypothetical protein
VAIEALLRQLDFHGQELRIIDAALGRAALERDEVRRLRRSPAWTPPWHCRSSQPWESFAASGALSSWSHTWG